MTLMGSRGIHAGHKIPNTTNQSHYCTRRIHHARASSIRPPPTTPSARITVLSISRPQGNFLGAILKNASFHGAVALLPGATDPNPGGGCSTTLSCAVLLGLGLIISVCSTSALALELEREGPITTPALNLDREGPAITPAAGLRAGAAGPAIVVAVLRFVKAFTV